MRNKIDQREDYMNLMTTVRLPACDGKLQIQAATNYFDGISGACLQQKNTANAKATPEIGCSIYKVREQTQTKKLLSLLSSDLKALHMTQNQIVMFIYYFNRYLYTYSLRFDIECDSMMPGSSFMFYEEEGRDFLACVETNSRGVPVIYTEALGPRYTKCGDLIVVP